MKQKLITIITAVFFFWSTHLASQGGVEQLIARLNPHVNLGIVVVDLNSGETLYSRNADHLFIPASNMKLFSEAAALMALGPDYRFENQLSTNANQIHQGVLHGNINLHLSGDPSFSYEDLHKLIAALKSWNIRAIQGDVIIDSALANVDAYPPGWLKSDLSYSYGAPIAPVMIDANRLTITINPAGQKDKPAIIELEQAAGIEINNHATTKASSKGCAIGLGLDENNNLTVNGCIGIGQWAIQQRMAIKNPLQYAQGLIKASLAAEGIAFQGEVQLGKAPAGSMILARVYSRPIAQLMADTLKPSDNLYADSLYLHTAAILHGSPVNWKQAEPIVKDFLQQQTQIDFSRSVFTDGSGLSRHNLVSPQQTIALLQFLYQRFPLSYEYIAALPISGRDGTLQKRFRIPSQQGFIRAKTGTMTGMNSLSGYLYANNGHTVAFAMFINRVPGGKPSGPGRPVLDALISYFLQHNPGSSKLAQVETPHQTIKFQSNKTEGDRQRAQQAKWRHLESVVKSALTGQAVNVLYRGNELIVEDNQSDANRVWSALELLGQKYSFAVAVAAKEWTLSTSGKPLLLWMQQEPDTTRGKRQWIIREAV